MAILEQTEMYVLEFKLKKLHQPLSHCLLLDQYFGIRCKTYLFYLTVLLTIICIGEQDMVGHSKNDLKNQILL